MASVSSDSLHENEETKKKTVLEEKSKEDLIKIVKKQLVLLQKAKAKSDELNKKCVALQDEKKLSQENESTTIVELQQQLEKLEICVSDLTEEKKKLNNEKNYEIQQFEEKLKALEHEKSKHLGTLNENEERLQCLSMQLNTMKETCHCFQDEIATLQRAKQEMEAEVIVLKEARDTALKSLKTQNILESKSEDYEEIKKKYSICIEENCSLTSTIEKLETDMKNLQVKNSNLLSKIENFTLSENQSSDNKCVDNDIMLLIADNQKLQSEVNLLQKENNLLREKVDINDASSVKNINENMSDKISNMEEIQALKKENQELLQNLCSIESSHSKLRSVNEDLESEKEVLKKELHELEEEKLKAILELDSAVKEKSELQEELKRLSSLKNFSDLDTGYEHALLQGATTQNVTLTEYDNNQNVNVTNITPELPCKNYKKLENQHFEFGFPESTSGFEFGLLAGGDVSSMLDNSTKEDVSKKALIVDERVTESATMGSIEQHNSEDGKITEIELRKLLANLQKEKDALAEEILKKEATCQEFSSLVEEVVADNESLKLKIDKYEHEKNKHKDIFDSTSQDTQTSLNISSEMVEKRFHEEKVAEIQTELKVLLSALEEKNFSLNEKIENLENEKTNYMKKCLSLSQELEFLKIEVQNLKTEIKNMEILKENVLQRSDVLEKQNLELSEKLDNQCSEIDDINFQIELLVISIKQGVRQKNTASPNKAENPLYENISLLKTLIDDLVILSNTNAIKIKNIESDMEDLILQKQVCDDELFQMRELNQFLEDEAKELRIEVEQLKMSSNLTDVYHRGKSPELYSIEEIDERNVSADANDENDASEEKSTTAVSELPINNVASEDGENIENLSGSNEIAIQSISEKETLTCDIADYKSIVEELKTENSSLKSSLEIKSKLVDGIHCQMDSLLEKIEAENLELKIKSDDLKNCQELVGNLQKRILELESDTFQPDILSHIKDVLDELKTSKDELKNDVLNLNGFSSDMLLSMSKSTIETLSNIEVKYKSLNNKYQQLEEIIGYVDSNLGAVIKNLKLWSRTLEEIYGKEGKSVDSEEMVGLIEQISESAADFSSNTILAEKIECDSFCTDLIEKIEHLCTYARQFSSIMHQYLSSSSYQSLLQELDSYKTNIVPNLETTIKSLKKDLVDYSSKKDCKETPEILLEQSMEKALEKSSEVDFKSQLAETEIKMVKFKQIALKLKKELAESKKQMNEVTKEKDKFQLKVSEVKKELEKISSEQFLSMQNYQSLQNEYDKIQDELDIQKDNCKRLEGDLSSTLHELHSFKEKFSDMESQLLKANQIIDAVTLAKQKKRKKEGDLSSTLHELHSFKEKFSDMESQLLKANQIIDAVTLAKQEKEKAFIDLESKLIIVESQSLEKLQKIEELETSLKQKMENITSLTLENNRLKDQLNHSLKEEEKSNLLNLEMADYERSIQELNNSIQKKDDEIEDLNRKLNSELERNKGLLEEIKFTETTKETEEKRAESLKESLEKAKSELTALKEKELELLASQSNLQMQFEILTQKEENCKLQLSETSSEVLHLKEVLKTSSENHQRIVRSLESKISSQKQEITSAHSEVENIKQEFENYKVRVHSVLKQQKSSTPTVVSVDDDVKEKLEAMIDKLKMQGKDLSEKLKAVSMEYETLQDEHDILLKRHSKALEDRDKKDSEWLSRIEQINAEKNKLRAAQEEQSSQHMLQNEMLVATYKKQIKIMSDEHKRVVNELQKQLESADMEISRLQRDQQKVQGLPPTPTFQDNAMAFDILSQERQEGEGSESIEELDTPIRHLSLSTIPTSGFLPFEKLLQSPADSGTPLNFVPYQDCEKMLADINAANKQIEHLSGVLNDSESTNLRLSEQVRVLKEEVRRLERNKEREEHTENMEYLKNVFIKFATLTAGSEKAMLIPVLTTMLKLSPAEQQQLKSIAGDIDPNETPNSGWGSYLHRWSGLA